jgi:hypothetical protein
MMTTNTFLSDTSPEAARVQLAALRAMPGSRRAEMAMEMSEAVRETARAGIRSRHPEYSDEQVHLAFLRLVLGEELFGQWWPGCEVRP